MDKVIKVWGIKNVKYKTRDKITTHARKRRVEITVVLDEMADKL